MSGRRRTPLSPSLFPFLAVLVCTLGTLILLLALVALEAQESAEKVVQNEARAAQLASEEERWEAERLISYRDSQTEELQRRHGELAHLEDHIRRLRDQLNALRKEVEAAEQPESSTNETRVAIEQLQQQIAKEQAKVDQLLEEQDGRPPRVVIVPYRGTHGTDRRPIYVECTDTALILQPEGVKITAAQLSGPLGPGNPLDAALRAVRSHWQKLDPNAPPPYPLLLVRPDGIHAYAAARIAMETWDDQFGYELIGKDLQLAFPEPDPQLKVVVAQAVSDAMVRNQSRMAGGSARFNRFTGNGTSGGGGNIADGRRDGRAGNGTGSSEFQTGDQFTNNDLSTKRELGNNTGFGTEPGYRPGTGTADAFNRGFGTGNAPAANEGQTGNERFAGSEGLAGNESRAGNEGLTGSDALSGSQELRGNQNHGLVGPEQPGSFEGGEDFGADGGTGNNPNSSVEGPGGTGMSAAGQMSGGAEGASSNTSASAVDTSGAAMPSQGTPSSDLPMDMNDQTFRDVMEQNSQRRANGQRPPADANGMPPTLSSENDWALPSSIRGQRGATIVRELAVDCYADRFVLGAEVNRGGQPQQFVIRDGLVEQAVLELGTAIRDRVTAWGPAMLNGRWSPVLRVRVAPDAETRFRQLQALMRNSGVRIEKETRR